MNKDKLINDLYDEFVSMIGHHSPSLKIKIKEIVAKCEQEESEQ